MKYFLAIIGSVIALGFAGSAFAFHDGGVAYCDGCHSMHGTLNASSGALTAGNQHLLKATDVSSTCLSCHNSKTGGGYHVSTDASVALTGISPLNYGPGGDFAWLKKGTAGTFSWTTPRAGSEKAERFGHNIVAADLSYAADTTNLVAPGGTFVSSTLACDSCHDPHGKSRRLSDGTIWSPKSTTTGAPIIDSGSYDTSLVPTTGQAVGVYRLLGGQGFGYGPSGGYPGNPAAVVPSTYNRTEDVTQTRTAYGDAPAAGHTTWGQWCATCHPGMITSGGSHRHPVDQTIGTTIQGNYNSYIATGNLGGSASSSFTSLVPFVEGGATYTTLASHAKNDNTFLNGPSSNDEVSCLTCHRAHASGFGSMLRWEGNSEFLTKAGAYPDNTVDGPYARGKTVAEIQGAYYNRSATVFASYQRSLCNKCHVQD